MHAQIALQNCDHDQHAKIRLRVLEFLRGALKAMPDALRLSANQVGPIIKDARQVEVSKFSETRESDRTTKIKFCDILPPELFVRDLTQAGCDRVR